MTLQEYQAEEILRAARALAHFVMTTDPDKRDWKPEVTGAAPLRSTLDMVAECIAVHDFFTAILRDETLPAARPNEIPRPFAEAEDGCALLLASAERLADAIRSMSEADLSREFPLRGRMIPGLWLSELPMRNMHYHSGQINLLQLLHGDAEFRPYRPS